MARIPTKIGKYPIEEKVAEGGMGAVYKGIHPTLNRPVILKRLTLKNSEHLTERFRREARMMMNFKNENIVNFYDHFKAGDSYYIVLEYIDGSDLSHLLGKERYLNCDLALYIFKESCKALKYAHKHHVIHRDIKPANIMFNSQGEVKLVDFGVAHEGSEEEAGLTTDGMTIGTPSYMAPEQFQDSRNVDNRADIYSMGVMLYQMVTGKKPFPGGYSPELIGAIQKNKYVNPVKINPDVNKTTRAIIKKCMKGSIEKRFKNVDQILFILDRYFRKLDEEALVDELKARMAGQEVEEKKKRKIRPLSLILVFVALMALGILGVISYQLGWIHEVFMGKSHGRLNISLEIDAEYKGIDQIYRRVEIFKDDDKTIPEIDRNLFFLRSESDNKRYHFSSLPLYLETGRYRVKIQIEDLLFWHTLYLPPRSIQKQDPLTERGYVLNQTIDSLPVSKLHVSWKISDCFNSRDLTKESTVEIFDGKRYIPFSNFGKDLLSGNIYQFKFSREGYFSKEYSLKIFPFQKELMINVNLTPRSSTLKINNTVDKAKIKINGENRYIEGGPVGNWVDIPPMAEGNNTYVLTPGIYLLEINRGRKKASYELELPKEELISLDVEWDQDRTEIIIKEIER